MAEESQNIPEVKKESYTSVFRKNPWVLSTLVLGIAVLILLVPALGLTGNVVSGDKAASTLLNYYTASGVSGLNVTGIKEVSGVYEVTFDYKGSAVPMYITKDGKFAGSLNSMVADPVTDTPPQDAPKDIPKTDKPVVELYVFTYCPYGLQMEKAFDSVVKLFGNKIDYKIRQIGAMHGDYEKVEAQRQLCIEKEYPSKFLQYVNEFAIDTAIGACSSDTKCSVPLVEALMTKLGIDKAKINSCMITDGVTMYDAEVSNAGSKGVSGSPTVIINGVETSLSRSPDAIKTAVCAAFTTAPSECSQVLSTSQASAGFGASTGSTTASTASC